MTLRSKMPLQVWILTLAAIAIGTAEFVIAGILTQVAESLNISEGQAGHLITAYALAIVFGGPILTLLLVINPNRCHTQRPQHCRSPRLQLTRRSLIGWGSTAMVLTRDNQS
ncbi:hypothetical protein N9741_02200 [Octadecabacter sp.]|nr:hypothetical protein [Octadecabacter sp.]